MKRIVWTICFFLFLFKNAWSNQTINYFVSTGGSDSASGTIANPFRTINRARLAIRALPDTSKYSKITVYIRGGTYILASTLVFSSEDSGSSRCPIEYKNYNNEVVIISGEKPIQLTWINNKQNDDVWTTKLFGLEKSALKQFRQLYGNGERLKKSSSKFFLTTNYPQMQTDVYNFSTASKLKLSNPDVYFKLEYKVSDFLPYRFANRNLELVVYHSWEVSYHDLALVDVSRKTLKLTNPFRYPIGFFGANELYRIENSPSDLNAPNQWCIDYENAIIYYRSNRGGNPNKIKFSMPNLVHLISIQGTNDIPVQYITFSGIIFSYTSGRWGQNDVYGYDKENNLFKNNTWIDLSAGFSSSQAAPDCGEAIIVRNAKRISFNLCEFKKIGAYGVRFGEYTRHCSVKNCDFTDLGGGGIILGFNQKTPIKDKLNLEMAPSHHNLTGNRIKFGGNLYVSAVGILIMQSHNNKVSANKISNMPYSGISCGWTWGFEKSFTFSNLISQNEIFDVMKVLRDGGGIYTLGVQENTFVINNYIHDIRKSAIAVGADANGFFFDEGSSGITVDSNVFERIEKGDFRFNKTSKYNNKILKNVVKDSVFSEKVKESLINRVLANQRR